MTLQKLPKMSNHDKSVIDSILSVFTLLKDNEAIFWDICFCIQAPQISYKKNRIMIERLQKKNFFRDDLSLEEVEALTREARFKRKAKYLLDLKKNFCTIVKVIRDEDMSWGEKRTWIVKNVNGLGMKTASHLLRNLGAREFAIVDTHIIKFLGVEQPKSTKDYLDIENQFKKISKKKSLSPAVLDSYIWKVYSGTPWTEFLF